MRRALSLLAVVLMIGVLVPAVAHAAYISFGQAQGGTRNVIRKDCLRDTRCTGWRILGCYRVSSRRIDCRTRDWNRYPRFTIVCDKVWRNVHSPPYIVTTRIRSTCR